MFKFLKLLFFAFLVLVGLYFFGDFRINDTNIKNYLHEKITLRRLLALKEQMDVIYAKIKFVFSDNPIPQPAAQNHAEAGKVSEHISGQDQEKLLKLLKKNLEKK